MEKPDHYREDTKQEKNKRSLQFTYCDNSNNGKIVFQCTAENILDADKLYEEKTGQRVEKQMYIGCSIKREDES